MEMKMSETKDDILKKVADAHANKLYSEAVTVLNGALVQYKSDFGLLLQLADTYDKMSEYDEALIVALKLRDSSEEIVIGIEKRIIKFAHNVGRKSLVFEGYARIFNATPQDMPVARAYISNLINRHEYEAAQEALETSLKYKPRARSLLVEKAHLYLALNDPATALKAAQLAIKGQSQNIELQSLIIEACEKLGNFEMAKQIWGDVKSIHIKEPHKVAPEQQLWNSLNQRSAIVACQYESEGAAFSVEALENYHKQHSKYKYQAFNLKPDSWAEKSLARKINVGAVDLMRRDTIGQFTQDEFEKNGIDEVVLTAKQLSPFKQVILATKMVSIICPLTGVILHSDSGFFVSYGGLPFFLYRFVSSEVFYLVIDDVHGDKLALYFPESETVLQLLQIRNVNFLTRMLNRFKSWMLANYEQAFEYIYASKKKDLGFVGSVLHQLGHALFNEVDAVLQMFIHGRDVNISHYHIGSEDYWHLGDLFPEMLDKPIQRHEGEYSIFKALINQNQLPIRPTHRPLICTDALADQVQTMMSKKVSEPIHSVIKQATQNTPLLWIEVRGRDRRVWSEQIQGNINIITKLVTKYPNMGVVFAGWTKNSDIDKEADMNVESELAIANKIIKGLGKTVPVYRVIGKTMEEKLNWAIACDAYIIGYGTGSVFSVAIGRKPGVLHSNSHYSEACNILDEYCEKAPRPMQIPRACVTDEILQDITTKKTFVRFDNSVLNYSFDWSEIYNRIDVILQDVMNKLSSNSKEVK